jgi:hypothetical protein
LQGLNQVSDFVPAKAKFWVAVAISGIQGVIAVISHFSNTDGTPQSVAKK